jgi:hypothetical protein
MAASFITYCILQIVEIGFFTVNGCERTKNAFIVIRNFFQILPNVFNCILLDHLPIVVANRYKYQRSLPKYESNRMMAVNASARRNEGNLGVSGGRKNQKKVQTSPSISHEATILVSAGAGSNQGKVRTPNGRKTQKAQITTPTISIEATILVP